LAKNSGPRTHASLLRRIKDLKDEAAWREFVDLYSPWINGWCSGWRQLSEQDAADLTQDILLKLIRVMPTFEYDAQGRFRSWLATVMCRVANSQWKKKKRQARARGGPAANAYLAEEEDARSSEAARETAKALDDEFVVGLVRHYLDRAEEMLTAEKRQSDSWCTFRAKYERDITDEEVAAEFQIPLGSARMRLSRARGWLRALGLDSTEQVRELRDDP